MSRDDYHIEVAACNGRPQRLITVDRADNTTFLDQINTNSATSRRRYIGRAAEKFGVEASELGWLDDAIIDAAGEADDQADAAIDDMFANERKSQATQLVEFGSSAELFHDPNGEAYARFEIDEHFEVAGVRTKYFRRWMARLFYLSAGKAPSSQSLQDAISVLEGKAIYEGPERPVGVRIAEQDDKIYVDLCYTKWQVVEVSTNGWRILDESPVMFRRAKAMLPLPTPVPGGNLCELRAFINMGDDDWTLFRAWLVAALRPIGPYPVLDIQGEHGSGKSTACRMARALVDPNTAMVRSEPREPRDLMISSKNGWVLAFDNLSGIRAWQSDCLCRLSTGGGFSTRTLYENDEETIFDAQRPVIINGIDEVATRADLLDRCLLLNLPRIEQTTRQSEAELWAKFEEARPRILGALLTAVASALQNLPKTKIALLPRMADFALWATAAEPALGLAPGQFLAAYDANRAAGNESAIEASPVGKAIIELVTAVGAWSGTATQLIEELESRASDKIKRLKAWPSDPRTLGGKVKRLAPNLREAGIGVEFDRVGKRRTRLIVLSGQTEQEGKMSSALSASSALTTSPKNSTNRADDLADANWTADANHLGADMGVHEADEAVQNRSSTETALFPEETHVADKADEADAGMHAHSYEQEWTEV